MIEERAAEASDPTPDLPVFRVLVVFALIASVAMTWPLWAVRDQPPLLPALGVPQVSIGLPLVAACVLALLAPRAGAAALTVILVYGMVADQTRMQPEFLSLPLLLWGSLPSMSLRTLAGVHVISLWLFAGMHKLASPDFLFDTGPRLVRGIPIAPLTALVPFAVLAIPLLEIGTGILAIVPRTRRLAAWLALVVHAGIVFALSPLADTSNVAILPWNFALACSGFALIAPWASRSFAELLAMPLLPRILATALVVAPAGFYLGLVDAYPAHHLYSAATATGTVYCPAGCRDEQDLNATWRHLNVPLPPEPRLFEATFRATCAPGDVLRVVEPHGFPPRRSVHERIMNCPAGSLPAAHP